MALPGDSLDLTINAKSTILKPKPPAKMVRVKKHQPSPSTTFNPMTIEGIHALMLSIRAAFDFHLIS